MLSMAKVRAVPAGTKLLKNPLKKNIEVLGVTVAAELMKAVLVKALTVMVVVLVAVYPLNVNCNDPPAGI